MSADTNPMGFRAVQRSTPALFGARMTALLDYVRLRRAALEEDRPPCDDCRRAWQVAADADRELERRERAVLAHPEPATPMATAGDTSEPGGGFGPREGNGPRNPTIPPGSPIPHERQRDAAADYGSVVDADEDPFGVGPRGGV